MKSENLEPSNNAIVFLEIFLRFLPPVKIKSLQPLSEPVKLRLALQLIGIDLSRFVSTREQSNLFANTLF